MTEASIPLRPIIREIMRAAPARQWSEAALHAQIRGIIPDVESNDVLAALLWNDKKGYVESTYNHELEVDVWKITDRGQRA